MHFLTWFTSTRVYIHKFGFYSSLSDPANNLAFIVD
nr:MAG TPA: hypothetical protein [Caudoviricetes sp.]